MSDEQSEREYAVTFTYIVLAKSAMAAMEKMEEPGREPDRLTIMPNMGI